MRSQQQHAKIKYLGCVLDECLSAESVAFNVIDQINSRLNFLQRQDCIFNIPFMSTFM